MVDTQHPTYVNRSRELVSGKEYVEAQIPAGMSDGNWSDLQQASQKPIKILSPWLGH